LFLFFFDNLAVVFCFDFGGRREWHCRINTIHVHCQKIQNAFTPAAKQDRKASKGLVLYLFLKDVQINYIISDNVRICICYLDVNWLIPKISAYRARIWSLLASERSERVTSFIFSRVGWYFSVSIIFTFRWHIYHS